MTEDVNRTPREMASYMANPCRYIPVDDVLKVWQPETPHRLDVAFGKRPCPDCNELVHPVMYSLRTSGEPDRWDSHCLRCFQKHLEHKNRTDDPTPDTTTERPAKARQGTLRPRIDDDSEAVGGSHA